MRRYEAYHGSLFVGERIAIIVYAHAVGRVVVEVEPAVTTAVPAPVHIVLLERCRTGAVLVTTANPCMAVVVADVVLRCARHVDGTVELEFVAEF